MNNLETMQIVALCGWLVLAASAFAGYRLSWKRSLVYALMWASIFALVFLVVGAVMPSASSNNI